MKKTLIVSLLTLTASLAQAQSQPDGNGGGGDAGHQEPPEIAAACAGKAVGTPVSVTFKDGKTRNLECGVHHHHENHGDGGVSAN